MMSVETSSKKKKKRNRKKKKNKQNKQNNQSIKRNNIVLEVIEEIEEIEEKKKNQQNKNILQSSLDKVDYLYTMKNTQTKIIQQLGETNKKNIFLNSKILKLENDIRLLMIFFQNKERDYKREKELQHALRLRELERINEEHKNRISELRQILKEENKNIISELRNALKLEQENSERFKNEMKIVLQYLFKMTNDMKEEKENNKKSFKVLDDITKTLTNHVKTISLHIKNLSISNVKNDKITDIITQKVGVINKQMGIVNQRVIRIQEDQELQKITEMYEMMNKNSNSPKNK